MTASIVKETVLLQAEIKKLSGHAIPEAKFHRWANALSMRLIDQLMNAILIDRERVRRGVKPTEESDNVVLKRFQKLTRQKNATVQSLSEMFGPLRTVFNNEFLRESRYEAFLETTDKAPISDEDVEIQIGQYENLKKKFTRENKEAWEKAECVWQRLKKGEAWGKVATESSEDKLLYGTNCTYDVEWETFPLKGYYEKKLAEELSQLKGGEFTRPTETDEGIVIAKVLSIEGKDYTCARILFRLHEEIDIPTKEEVVAGFRSEMRQKAQDELLHEILQKTPMTYPMGKRFAYKIWPEPEKKKSIPLKSKVK